MAAAAVAVDAKVEKLHDAVAKLDEIRPPVHARTRAFFNRLSSAPATMNTDTPTVGANAAEMVIQSITEQSQPLHAAGFMANWARAIPMANHLPPVHARARAFFSRLSSALATMNTDTPTVGANAAEMVVMSIRGQFGSIPEVEVHTVVARVSDQVISGLELVPTDSASADQGGNNDEVSIAVDTPTEPQAVSLLTRKLAPALLTVGILTAAADISTAFYKPAKGVVFGPNKAAYYLTLSGILASGAMEIITAVWLARSGADDGRRRFSFGRALLCVSIVPFVAIMAINGVAVTEA